MIVKLFIEHHLEFLSLKEGCRGSSESTHVKMPHCWKSHAQAHISCSGFVILFQFGNHLAEEEKADCLTLIWNSTRQSLPSRFPTKRDSNQSPRLQRLAKKLKFHL